MAGYHALSGYLLFHKEDAVCKERIHSCNKRQYSDISDDDP